MDEELFMINLNLSISYPFSERFKMLVSTSGILTKHKAIETSAYRTAVIIKLALSYTVRGDHAGLHIEFGLFGYECELRIYDTRHWDYKAQQWETANEN